MAQANLTFRPSGPLPWPVARAMSRLSRSAAGRATGFLTAMRLAGPPPPEIGRRRQRYRPRQPSQAWRRRPLTCRLASAAGAPRRRPAGQQRGSEQSAIPNFRRAGFVRGPSCGEVAPHVSSRTLWHTINGVVYTEALEVYCDPVTRKPKHRCLVRWPASMSLVEAIADAEDIASFCSRLPGTRFIEGSQVALPRWPAR